MAQITASKSLAAKCKGRIIVNDVTRTVAGDTRKGAVVTVYQFGGQQTRLQEMVLHALTTVLRHLRELKHFLLVSGDFNAALPGERRNYGKGQNEADRLLAEWLVLQNFVQESTRPRYTWRGQHGEQQANIDHVWVWSVDKDTAGPILRTQESHHAGHDHQMLVAELGEDILPDSLSPTKVISTRAVDMRYWHLYEPDWLAELAAKAPTIISAALTKEQALKAVLWEGVSMALAAIGKDVGSQEGVRGGMNKTVRRLHWVVRQLKAAVGELQIHGAGWTSLAITKAEEICNPGSYARDG